MPKLNEARTSALNFDGAMVVLVSPGDLDLATAETQDGPMLPFGGKIVGAWLKVITAPDAASVVSIGNSADSTDHGSYTVATTASGLIDILGDLTDLEVSPGDFIKIASDGASTAAASCAVTLVISPNA